jgi:tRNA dimethylallyltransferase
MEQRTTGGGAALPFHDHASLYPLVAIVGPSASGKSDLALSLAERYNAEIINFDSVQVYRGFDIGAAKVPADERRGIPHHLLDILRPEELMTAGSYAQRAREVIRAIRLRERLPLFAGGTGLYFRAAVKGLFSGPRRDEQLRERLSGRAASKPAGYLPRLLVRLDSASAARIHPNDTLKIIRAIEVCIRGRAPMSEQWAEGTQQPLEGYDVIRIGLNPPRALLRERIARRGKHLFEAGLLEEVRQLLDRGIPRTVRPFGSLGYRQALDHLDGKLTLEQAIEETTTLTRRYAKRQMTWFRREPDVQWFAGFGDNAGIVAEVTAWLGQRLAGYR